MPPKAPMPPADPTPAPDEATRDPRSPRRPATRLVALRLALCLVLAPCVPALAQSAPATAAAPSAEASWVEVSNQHAQLLLELQAKYGPESAGQIGIDGYDEEITQIPLDLVERQRADLERVRAELTSLLAAATHPQVRQDLEIMLGVAEDAMEGDRLTRDVYLPTFDLAETVFSGIRTLLDDQVPEERRRAALVRLEKYAGTADGFTPLATQAEAYIRSRLGEKQLVGPFREDLEKDLANAPRYVEGIAELFERYEIDGWQEAHAALVEQLDAYHAFVRAEVMPRTTDDFRLPEPIYLYSLDQVGIDMSVDELTSRAKTSFREIQNEMQSLAGQIAAANDLPSSDYRDVLRHLKANQVEGDEILALYQRTIASLEETIEEQDVLTLPERDMRIRLATPAEAAQTPAPNMRPPRLIGNTGEMGEFVLPLKIPSQDGSEEVGFDDFTFEAAAWTLTVHEGRPGHELQFASIIESGVSLARILYAFNSVNVEGWALYAEAEMKPYLPLEGQLASLQHRLLRSARAFLDPGLQLGTISREEAFRVLQDEVVMSRPMAEQEVERYTFRSPGQAPSYFCGYSRLMELRTDVERLLGDRFDRRAYHDFVLAQGLLPPSLLRQAVMDGFVAPRRAASAPSTP